MVLESLFNPLVIKKRPYEMFLSGLIYSLVAFFLSFLIFKEAASILLVTFIVIAALPFLYLIVLNEEEIDLKISNENILLKEHGKVILALTFLFLGITAGLVFLYLFMPEGITQSVFSLQKETITRINTGAVSLDIFSKILTNNLRVLFFSFLFSFIFGTGALFILVWNASVIAVAVGAFIKIEIAQISSLVGLHLFSDYLGAVSKGFLRYFIHGLPEITAYWIAGLAGGIISIAVIKHHLKNPKIFYDASLLFAISLIILILAALVEVYITPLFF